MRKVTRLLPSVGASRPGYQQEVAAITIGYGRRQGVRRLCVAVTWLAEVTAALLFQSVS
jgi:hypothetical protein